MVDPLLQDMVRIVSNARDRAAVAKLTLLAQMEQFKKDHAAEYQEANDAAMLLETTETALRTAAKEHVDAHKGVTSGLPAGVGARKGVDLDYDHKAAFRWSRETGVALILDTKAFEVIAKNTDLPFVTKTPTISITLARDFKKADVEPAPVPVAVGNQATVTAPAVGGLTEEDPF